jgi:hypothetical protein
MEVIDMTKAFKQLDDDDQRVVADMMHRIVVTLEKGEGTVVLLMDVLGNGTAEVVAAGNPLLVEPLLRTAALVSERLFSQQDGYTQ